MSPMALAVANVNNNHNNNNNSSSNIELRRMCVRDFYYIGLLFWSNFHLIGWHTGVCKGAFIHILSIKLIWKWFLWAESEFLPRLLHIWTYGFYDVYVFGSVFHFVFMWCTHTINIRTIWTWAMKSGDMNDEMRLVQWRYKHVHQWYRLIQWRYIGLKWSTSFVHRINNNKFNGEFLQWPDY